MKNRARRIVILDASQTGFKARYLSLFWMLGSLIGGFDHVIRAKTWRQAYQALGQLRIQLDLEGAYMAHIEFFGHGRQGQAFIGDEVLDAQDLKRAVLVESDSVFWIRACDCFGGYVGGKFAELLANALDCRVAGHTRVVSGDSRGIPGLKTVWFQSGLYGLKPGQEPYWDRNDDGGSSKDAPHTVDIFDFQIPAWAWR